MKRKFNEFIEVDKSYISLKDELGGVVTLAASWSSTQEVAGSNAFDDKYKTFRENSVKRDQIRIETKTALQFNSGGYI